jgi:hypothetical protein
MGYFNFYFYMVALVGDIPRGPLNNRGKPTSSRKKRTHNTITTLVAPVAHQSG